MNGCFVTIHKQLVNGFTIIIVCNDESTNINQQY
jgi:hypothetical protein